MCQVVQGGRETIDEWRIMMEKQLETIFINCHKPAARDLIEFKNARFVDVINGCFFDEGTHILTRNGKIEAILSTEEAASEINPDLSVDLNGKTVLPGLFNVHCHIQMINPTLFSSFKTIKDRKTYHDQQVDKNMSDCLAHGITNIRDAYTDDLLPNRQLRDRIQKGDIPGPRIQQAVVVGASGGYLTPDIKGFKKKLLGIMGLVSLDHSDSRSGIVSFPSSADTQVVRDAVDRALEERGADVIKVGESLEESLLNPNPGVMSMDQMQAITDQARRKGLQSTIHSVSVETFRRAVTAGFSSLAHMARDGDLTTEDIETCLQSGSIIEPTLSVGYDMSWKLKGNPFANDPNMDALYAFRNSTFSDIASSFWLPELSEHVISGYNKANQGKYKMLGLLNLSKIMQYFSPIIHYAINNSQRLVEQGVPMACGNDGGIQACTPVMVAHELLIFDLFMNRQADKKVFNEIKALQTATINSAISMGIDNAFGSIEVGKVADFAVIDGNPFEDASVIGKPVAALFMDSCLKINNCGIKF
jgi:imidazolonepropionase-like amidohydrolase